MARESPTSTMSTPAEAAVFPWLTQEAVTMTTRSPRSGAVATQGTVTFFISPAMRLLLREARFVQKPKIPSAWRRKGREAPSEVAVGRVRGDGLLKGDPTLWRSSPRAGGGAG